MISSSIRGAVHAPRNVDELIAAEWALEDLRVEELYPEMTAGEPGVLDEAARAAAAAAEEAAREAERQRLLEEAYARGYEAGRREGEEAEGARLRNAVAAVEQVLGEVQASEERWVGSIEENICSLAVAVARQIMDRELKGDHSVVEQLVRHALAEFPIDQPVRIRVNPMDLTAIASRSPSQPGLPAAVADREVHWLADSRVAPGGCVVEGKERIIDGRVDTALERVYRRLTYAHA